MSMLSVANLTTLASRIDEISIKFNSLLASLNPLPVFITFSRHQRNNLSPQEPEVTKNSLGFLRVLNGTVPSYNMH